MGSEWISFPQKFTDGKEAVFRVNKFHVVAYTEHDKGGTVVYTTFPMGPTRTHGFHTTMGIAEFEAAMGA